MAVARNKPPHRAGIKPGAQPVYQFGKRAYCLFFPVKTLLHRGKRVALHYMQFDPVITKARIKRIGQGGNAFVKQPEQRRGIACGCACRNFEFSFLAVAAIENQNETPSA